jgi:serine/threonine protein kinase HipA of HipAB toxin-antitoxin module
MRCAASLLTGGAFDSFHHPLWRLQETIQHDGEHRALHTCTPGTTAPLIHRSADTERLLRVTLDGVGTLVVFFCARQRTRRCSTALESDATKRREVTASGLLPPGDVGWRRGSQQRNELINTGTDKRYVRRSASGQFKESDDVGRSLKRDRQQKANGG